METERLQWLRIKGIPCHVRGTKFFSMLTESIGSFIKCDDITMTRLNMEEARVCIKSECKVLIYEEVNVSIEGKVFAIHMREDPPLMKAEVVERKCLEEEF